MQIPKTKTSKMIEIEERLGEPLSSFLKRRYKNWDTITSLSQELGVDYGQLGVWFKFFNIKTRGTGPVRRLEKIKLSERCKQIIYGSILGDGHLFLPTETTQYAFSEKHSKKQEVYLRWKARLLSSLSPLVYEVMDKSAYTEHMYVLQMSSCQFFTELRQETYPKGVKIIPASLLERLAPLGLAVWFMDDGSISDENHYFEWRLHTNGFDNDSIEIALGYFRKKYAVYPTTFEGAGGRIMRFKKSDTIKLMGITRRHFPECMRYKLRSKHV